jgi:translocation and assembly module TamB
VTVPRRPGAVRRATGALAKGVGVALVFCLASVLGLVLHLNLPTARRIAVRQFNALVAERFQGKLTLERLDRLSLFGIGGARAQLVDPEGRRVLLADSVAAKVAPFAIARSALFGKGDLTIAVREVTIEFAEASVDADEAGTLQIERALAAKHPTPSKPAARGTTIAIENAIIRRAWIHGRPKGAPMLDVELGVLHVSVSVGKATTVDLARVALHARGMPNALDLEGDVEAHLAIPQNGDLSLAASFLGAIGGIPTSAHGSMDGPRIVASVDVPKVPSERVRRLAPQAPLYDDVALHLEASGTLPNLDGSAQITLGQGTVSVFARATIEEELFAIVNMEARGIDAHAFSTGVPRSEIDATLRASLAISGESMGVDFAVQVLPGTLGDDPLPAAHFSGRFRREGERTTLRARGHVAERGVPTELTVSLDGTDGSQILELRAQATVPRLDRVRWLGHLAKGNAKLQAIVRVDLGIGRSIDALLEAELDALERGEEKLRHAFLEAHATGALDAPAIRATLRAEGLEASGRKFSRASLAVKGNTKGQDVSLALDGINAPSVRAEAHVALGDVIALQHSALTMWRNGKTISARIGLVRIAKDDLRVEDVVVDGLGEPVHASVHQTKSVLTVVARSEGVDFGFARRLLGVERPYDGRASFDVDLSLRESDAVGHVVLDLRGGSFPGISTAADVHLDANIDHLRLVAELVASVEGIGRARLKTAKLDLGSSGPETGRAWREATGAVDLDLDIDLDKVEALTKDLALPFTELGGRLAVRGKLARGSQKQAIPSMTLTAVTKGLAVKPKAASRLSGIDVELTATIDGTTGATTISGRLFDKEGNLLVCDAKSDAVPYDPLLASKTPSFERLSRVGFSTKLVVPRRAVAKLPAILGYSTASGQIEGSLSIEGTLLEPKVDFLAKLDGFSWRASPSAVAATGGMLLGSEVRVRYDGKDANLAIEVWSPKQRLLAGTANVKATMANLLGPRLGDEHAWEASARLRATGFPLGTLEVFSDRRIRGKLDGDIAIDSFHKDARAKIDLAVNNLEVGTAKYLLARLLVTTDARLLEASARLDQADGFGEVKAKTGILWGSALFPKLDQASKLDASFTAKRLQAAAILPFVEQTLSQLDGRIDADAHVLLDPGSKTPKLRGTMALSEGVFQVGAIGGELHDVKGKIVLSDESVRMEAFEARGLSGRVTANGVARLSGLAFAGATASVKIDRRETIPLEVQGVTLGDVSGEFTLKATPSPDGKRLDFDVDVPVMHVELPRASSSHDLQPLEEAKHLQVGVYRSGGRFVILPTSQALARAEKAAAAAGAQGTEIVISVHLRQGVDVKQGSGLKVSLSGNPVIKLKDKAVVSGQIRLHGGFLEVQGRRFEIEKGTVSFLGPDPSDPQVVVTAGWTAPDGTRVFADYVGPLKTGKVTLRSEPTRPKNEIVALILFGSADSSSAAELVGASTATKGAVAAGSFAGEGLTKGLDDLTGLDVTVKIDTTSANPRPELEIQLARDISLQIAVVLGTPAPGTNPDRTWATIAWRFRRNWSLDATFGDAGSSLADVVWQRAY